MTMMQSMWQNRWKGDNMLTLYGASYPSRLLLGTAGYPTLSIMLEAIRAAHAPIITVSLRRQSLDTHTNNTFWEQIQSLPCQILPNTAGCHDVQSAVTTAQMARELFETNWIKLELIGDDYTLQPDPFALLEATHRLVQAGFNVFPYCTEDLILCQRLVDAGCEGLMPWGAPIGTGQGLRQYEALQTLRERLPNTTLIIDAGIGKPSHAATAMEIGFDGVLLNTAIASAQDPVTMARAFAHAVTAGEWAYHAGIMPVRQTAHATTPIIDTPFWHQPISEPDASH